MRDGVRPERTWEKVLAASIVPLSVLGGLGAEMWMMRAGVAPAVAVLPVSVGAFLVAITMERILPWHEAWNHSRGDRARQKAPAPVASLPGAATRVSRSR
jgi:hypothetical protein